MVLDPCKIYTTGNEFSFFPYKLDPESILGILKASVFGRGGGASSAKRHLLRSILLLTDVGLQNVTNSKLSHEFHIVFGGCGGD